MFFFWQEYTLGLLRKVTFLQLPVHFLGILENEMERKKKWFQSAFEIMTTWIKFFTVQGGIILWPYVVFLNETPFKTQTVNPYLGWRHYCLSVNQQNIFTEPEGQTYRGCSTACVQRGALSPLPSSSWLSLKRFTLQQSGSGPQRGAQQAALAL